MTAAVITGASAGLGAEFTRQLVREFPDIEEFWLIARRVGKLEELAQQFPDRKFVCIGLNLLDPKSFRYLGEKLAEQKADVERIQARTSEIVRKTLSWQEMRPLYIEVYKKTFSSQDVKAIAKFYESAAGRSLLDKTPLLMQNLMAAIQQKTIPMMEALQAELQESTKPMPAPAVTPPAKRKKKK